MDTSQYDSQIQTIETGIEQLRKRMESVRLAYLKATEGFLEEWFRKTIENAVISKPEHTKSLGVEGLRSLKSELEQLIDKVPGLVQEHVAQEKLWPHLVELSNDLDERSLPAHDVVSSTVNGLRESIRQLLGYAGQLLVAYNFEGVGKNSVWEKRSNGLPRYRYGYGWSQQMDARWTEYTDFIKNLVRATLKLKKVKQEKATAEAKHLWDKA